MSANPALPLQLLDALDGLSGSHPGSRPVHAKGLICSGTFTPSLEAAQLTRAPHASRQSTPVTVRYSNAPGVPASLDNDPQSGPRGIAVRFHLADHVHTDIIAHSVNGFPVRSGEEFLEFLRAAAAFGAGKPEAFGSFLATHPHAKRSVETPKPIPTSFAWRHFSRSRRLQVSTNAHGLSRHGRLHIRPMEGTEYLSSEEAAAKSGNFLFEEIGPRLAGGPFRLGVFVQMAEPGDDVTDASVTWPDSREEIPFGTVTVTARLDEQVPERRKVIFDPVPRIDGIESSGDPLTEIRSDLYLRVGDAGEPVDFRGAAR